MIDREMRRRRQQLSPAEADEILQRGKVAVWAVADDDGYPYAVPVNYVCADGVVYIHSARQGHKIDAIARCAKCSLCVVDRDDVVPAEFTSYFRSVIAFGRAHVVESGEEAERALRLLSAKYSPGIDPTAEIAKFRNNVCVVCVRLERVSGKEAVELSRKR